MKKSEFKKIILECVHEINESDKSDYFKKQKLQKMADKDTSFAGWMKKYGERVGKTKGTEEELVKLIDDAIKAKELKISDKYYKSLMDQIKSAKNPMKRMSVLYNNMLVATVGKVENAQYNKAKIGLNEGFDGYDAIEGIIKIYNKNITKAEKESLKYLEKVNGTDFEGLKDEIDFDSISDKLVDTIHYELESALENI